MKSKIKRHSAKRFLVHPQEAIKHTLKMKRKMDIFYEAHCLNSNDPLIIILKTHLYIEELINQLFLLVLPEPHKILKKRFSEKIDILEALSLNVPPDKNNLIVKKMRVINKLRNSFVHKLGNKLTFNDFRELIDKTSMPKGSNVARLKCALSYFIGYFHFLLTISKFFPFASTCIRSEKIFKRDKGYSICKIIYPWRMLLNSLPYFKMK